MKCLACFLLLDLAATNARTAPAQSIGIGTTTPHPSALLDLSNTTQGLLLPCLTLARRLALPSPAAGPLVQQTDGLCGLYRYTGTGWQWQLGGQPSTSPDPLRVPDVRVTFAYTAPAQPFVVPPT